MRGFGVFWAQRSGARVAVVLAARPVHGHGHCVVDPLRDLRALLVGRVARVAEVNPAQIRAFVTWSIASEKLVKLRSTPGRPAAVRVKEVASPNTAARTADPARRTPTWPDGYSWNTGVTSSGAQVGSVGWIAVMVATRRRRSSRSRSR